MDNEEKIEQAKIVKEKGTTYFKNGKLNLACKMYKKTISYLDSDKGN